MTTGCWWHQQAPVISRGNKIVLEEGMVLALEPAKEYYHIQDMVVVRARGPEWISDMFNTDQMFVIE
jgi:Xaa-Pro aminopeptidase